MSGFFQNLLQDSVSQIKTGAGQAVKSFFGNEYLRDYTHAAKTFRPNAYQYAPKFKFLFHVQFQINNFIENSYATPFPPGTNLGLAVKTIKLPSYQFDTHVMNQYNRKRLVQTKIKYEPIEIQFHDDNGNMINKLWYNYYTYYYKDAMKQAIQEAGNNTVPPGSKNGQPVNSSVTSPYNIRTTYNPSTRGDGDWGYIGESSTPTSISATTLGQTKIPFFKNISIYGFNQHNFIEYTLINPIITKFSHDTYSYAETNSTMQNTMSIDYESVAYSEGKLDGKNPSNIISSFGNETNYDRTLSPIARPGSQANILGQGGLVDAAGGIAEDLSRGNILGAIQKSGATYNTFKNGKLQQAVRSEINNTLYNATLQSLPGNPRSERNFPAYSSTPSPAQAGSTAGTGQANPPPVTPVKR
jgi:hypothetical protein